MEYWNEIIAGLDDTSIEEYIAVFSGIIYVVLAAKKIRWCWWFAMLSTGLYIYLCYVESLYIESFLQMFYFGMAIYGWLYWSYGSKKELPIARWSLRYHLINIFISGIVSLLLGWIMARYTEQSSPYLDAFTSVFSLAATFMVAKRILENWIYWIVIDVALFFLYTSKGYELTGLHYGLFAIFAIVALNSWWHYYKRQTNND